MSSITIIGPGAIGGTVAAWLAQDKANRISICARTPFDRLELDAPEGQLLATPQLFTSPEEAKEAGWVLIATKAYDVAAIAVPPIPSIRCMPTGLQDGP